MSPKKKEKNRPKLAEGFLVSISLPSEGLVQQRYSEQELILEDKVQKVFDITPRQFPNEFKAIRRRIYMDTIPSHCIKLGGKGAYLLPKDKVPSFLLAMEEHEAEFLQLGENINKYLRSKHAERLKRVKAYYKSRQALSTLKPPQHIPMSRFKLSVSLIPFTIGESLWEKMLSVKMKKAEREAMERYRSELSKRQKEAIDGAIADLMKRLQELIRGLAQTAAQRFHGKAVNAAERSIEQVEDLAKATRTQKLFGTILKDSKGLIKVLRTKDLTQIEPQIESLARKAGVIPKPSLGDTLMDVAQVYGKTTNVRALAILRRKQAEARQKASQ